MEAGLSYDTWGGSWAATWKLTWTPSTAVVSGEPASGVDTRKKKRRTIRFSDLDARERLEAKQEIVAALAPLAPIEQAAVNLSEARGEETEDDELILMALTRFYH